MPEVIGVVGGYEDSLRDTREHSARWLGDSPGFKSAGVRQQCEVTLVCKCCVGVWGGRHDDRAIYIGPPQGFVLWLGQVEIDQSIVDHVDRLAAADKRLTIVRQLCGIRDQRDHPTGLEQALRQKKFGIKVLRLGRVIDDGDDFGLVRAPLEPPFRPEHRNCIGIKARRPRVGDSCRHLSTASKLRLRPKGVQEGAAGICVDLDETPT